jgi:tetratricopeptide (TPR) repeat protein
MATEVWQGGLVRMPAWIEQEPDGKPYRPWGAAWVSLRTGRLNQLIEPAPGAHDHGLALEALVEFGLRKSMAGCRPERIEVADEALAASLREIVGDSGTAISVVGQLPAVRAALNSFAEFTTGRPLPPDAVDAPGVTVERMRAFAAAAEAFYRAAPWRYLSDEDLLRVEAPEVDPGLRYLSVLGGAAVTYGLGFFRSPEELEMLLRARGPEDLMEGQDRWTLWFGDISELSFGDVELWEEHGLPVAGEAAYPSAVRWRADGEMERPDAGALADLEALLLALAATTEEEIDRGRWQKEVRTTDGPTTVRLSLPALLEPLDAPVRKRPAGIPDRRVMERAFAEIERFMAESNFQSLEEANAAIQERFMGRPIDEMPSTAVTPLEKAQDVMYRAFDARGRRRIQLAKHALELCPDCADAYVLLAEASSDPEAALDFYAQAVAAGERALGPAAFAEPAGEFWGPVRTRPYMRARLGLAQCLEELGREDEAVGHYKELLRLNPNDNQGVRDILLPLLLRRGDDAGAGALLQQYAEDVSATWKYGWALWTFRQEGNSPAAIERLREAIKTNRHVPRLLLKPEQMPHQMPDAYAFGSPDEAALCAVDLLEAWEQTPGAIPWLLSHAPPKKTGAPKRRRR